MNASYLLLALGPLAVYLLILGWINLVRRPIVVSGTWEVLGLALGLVGLVVVGPMQLFMPEQAANRFGPWVWSLLLVFYILCVMLWLLAARPRLVIYNISLQQLQPALSQVAAALDSQATWVGETLALPQLGVHVTIEDFGLMRNVSLVATGNSQNLNGWRQLKAALRGALAGSEVAPNPRGITLVTTGIALVILLAYKGFENPQELAKGLIDLLRL